jgi:hypothetical protein
MTGKKEVPECGSRVWQSEEEGFKKNDTLTKAFRKSSRRLSANEIRAEAHKRQKEMRDAARAAEMAVEELALEKLKDLAEKEAALKATTG